MYVDEHVYMDEYFHVNEHVHIDEYIHVNEHLHADEYPHADEPTAYFIMPAFQASNPSSMINPGLTLWAITCRPVGPSH